MASWSEFAAASPRLAEAIRVGRFRDDLYYRLRVVPIHVPPLRERVEDIPLIAHHLLAHIGGREGRALLLSPDTLAAMARYPWPGNVRELGNALEYAVATCTGQTIQIENLPPELRQGEERAGLEPVTAQDAAPLGDPLAGPRERHPPPPHQDRQGRGPHRRADPPPPARDIAR